MPHIFNIPDVQHCTRPWQKAVMSAAFTSGLWQVQSVGRKSAAVRTAGRPDHCRVVRVRRRHIQGHWAGIQVLYSTTLQHGQYTVYTESQKSIDFRAAAFLGQNISAKVRKTRHFVLFEQKCVIFDFFCNIC